MTAQIAQREAAVRQIEVDLRNTEIKSPVYGVVVQRNVELGATVAASLQAPTLFLIADDLRRMEIAANIDETDVGRIKSGQRVTFTVTAYPGRTFEGVVKQVRLGSQTVQNVVIYTTIVSIENPRLELAARHDRESADRDRPARQCRAHSERRPALASAVDRAGRSRARARRLRRRKPAASARGGGRRRRRAHHRIRRSGQDRAQSRRRRRRRRSTPRSPTCARSFARQCRRRTGSGARRERGRAARQDLEERIAAVLNAEQRAKFDEIRKRLTESGGARGRRSAASSSPAGRQAAGVTVRIGATDGGMTEIVSGLEAGREVIIGGGPRADAATTRGPRFGF